MENNLKVQDEKLRVTIVSRVLLGVMIIGFVQSIITILGHKSDSTSLYLILTIIPFSCIGYFCVRRYKSASVVGRLIIYFSVPVLIFRAHNMGGVWGATTNWIYLLPVFSALFLSLKELIFLLFFTTCLIIALGIAHQVNPEYAIQQLLLVPVAARVIYIIMPLYVIAYIINFYEKQRKLFLKTIDESNKKQLQDEKLISIGAMSAGMAHEINNPLTILSGSLNLLKKQLKKNGDLDDEKINRHLSNLDFGIERISKIVLSVKSLSSDSEKLSVQQFFLKDIIKNALVLQESNLKINEIEFYFNDLDDVELHGVKIQIEQILMNFIVNSIYEVSKHTKPWIRIKTILGENNIKILCIDSGNGIEDHIVKNLFDPFFTSKDIGQGIGLGLSLSKKMAKRHNGDIYYEIYDGNTAFVLELPYHLDHLNMIEID